MKYLKHLINSQAPLVRMLLKIVDYRTQWRRHLPVAWMEDMCAGEGRAPVAESLFQGAGCEFCGHIGLYMPTDPYPLAHGGKRQICRVAGEWPGQP